ncbi:PREDICTED: DNA-directed RNA polymerase II subunit RPB7 [Chlamydotis macqueenii]|uniref:DNA-directed RNA polymerase II subunit RPB7 n=1 Tax=Chlamydotis macqueenii TaxID=187382 RepID=UPI000529F010|nr:PREDICTED: DNA-directed RNA polymerase II subunit RPB7 [Chlamydotis macqueenii]
MGAAENQVKKAGPSAGAGSMSPFISCRFILSEMELDPNFNPPCYKTVLILIRQWLSKSKIQLKAREARMDRITFLPLHVSLMDEYLHHPKTATLFFLLEKD